MSGRAASHINHVSQTVPSIIYSILIAINHLCHTDGAIQHVCHMDCATKHALHTDWFLSALYRGVSTGPHDTSGPPFVGHWSPGDKLGACWQSGDRAVTSVTVEPTVYWTCQKHDSRICNSGTYSRQDKSETR